MEMMEEIKYDFDTYKKYEQSGLYVDTLKKVGLDPEVFKPKITEVEVRKIIVTKECQLRMQEINNVKLDDEICPAFVEDGIDYKELPIIIFYDEKEKNYVIFDGHHRYVMFNKLCSNKKIPTILLNKNPYTELPKTKIRNIQHFLNKDPNPKNGNYDSDLIKSFISNIIEGEININHTNPKLNKCIESNIRGILNKEILKNGLIEFLLDCGETKYLNKNGDIDKKIINKFMNMGAVKDLLNKNNRRLFDNNKHFISINNTEEFKKKIVEIEKDKQLYVLDRNIVKSNHQMINSLFLWTSQGWRQHFGYKKHKVSGDTITQSSFNSTFQSDGFNTNETFNLIYLCVRGNIDELTSEQELYAIREFILNDFNRENEKYAESQSNNFYLDPEYKEIVKSGMILKWQYAGFIGQTDDEKNKIVDCYGNDFKLEI